MNIQQLTDIYLRQRAFTEASIKHYRFVTRIFTRDTDIENVDEITLDVLLRWRDVVLERGASRSTWNNYISHMRALLNFAVQQQICVNPPKFSQVTMPTFVDRPKVLRPEQLQVVMVYVSSETSAFQPHWFWATLLRTLYYTGMRRRQIAQLKWGDIDLRRRAIELRAESSKNRRAWEIPIVELLAPSLLELRRHTVTTLVDSCELKERYVFDIALFSNKYYSCRNGHISVRAISNFFLRLRALTGIDISAHKLRHTMATELARIGRYKDLQILLGHTNIRTTMRYVHPDLDDLRVMTNNIKNIG